MLSSSLPPPRYLQGKNPRARAREEEGGVPLRSDDLTSCVVRCMQASKSPAKNRVNFEGRRKPKWN